MNDQRFHDLAMKSLARQATEAERAELDSLMVDHPELRTEFERLRGDVRVAREALPMAAATEATAGDFPAYARERLQTKVRQTLGGRRRETEEAEQARGWTLRLCLGLATATVVILTLMIPTLLKPAAPAIHVAMLDIAGGTRGGDTNDLAVFRAVWKDAPARNFSTVTELQAWEQEWPASDKLPTVKIIFDRSAGEIRVLGRIEGRQFQKTFVVERDLRQALSQAHEFVSEQLRR